MRGIIGRKDYLDYLIVTYGSEALLSSVIAAELAVTDEGQRSSVEDDADELARITAKIKQATKRL